MKKSLVTLLTLVLILNALALYGYYFFYSAIKDKNEHIALLADEVQAMTEKETTLGSLKNIVSDTAKERGKLESFFVDRDGVSDFIAQIEKYAQDLGLDFTVRSINVEEASVSNASSTNPVLVLHLATSGSWNSSMNYFVLLENLPYKMTFQAARLSQAPAQTDPKTKVKVTSWNASVDMSVMLLK